MTATDDTADGDPGGTSLTCVDNLDSSKYTSFGYRCFNSINRYLSYLWKIGLNREMM